MIKFEDLQKANESIKTVGIERKSKDGKVSVNEYAEVNQRVKAFRMVYPTGSITTKLESNENGVCVFTAEAGYCEDGVFHTLATGTAYEKENNGFINKTSYIENCETSAVGRALGFAGFGIDTSIASAEEVQNAQLNQKEEPAEERKATPNQLNVLKKVYTGDTLSKLLASNSISKIEDLSLEKASELIKKIEEVKK